MENKYDFEFWRPGTGGKSLAYFSEINNPSLNQEMLDKLKRISVSNGKVTMRFCLHKNKQENLQDMVILAYKDKLCKKPHKHIHSNEAISLIEGEMFALMFDEQGNLIDKKILKKEVDFIYRNPKDTYHLFLPITDHIIYRETIGGEFKPSEPAEWDYNKTLQENIDMDLKCQNESCKNPCSFNINQ